MVLSNEWWTLPMSTEFVALGVVLVADRASDTLGVLELVVELETEVDLAPMAFPSS